MIGRCCLDGSRRVVDMVGRGGRVSIEQAVAKETGGTGELHGGEKGQ